MVSVLFMALLAGAVACAPLSPIAPPGDQVEFEVAPPQHYADDDIHSCSAAAPSCQTQSAEAASTYVAGHGG